MEETETEIASPPVEIHYLYNASLASDPGLPRTYEEAMSGQDKLKWSKAIEKELANFEKRKVWKQVQRATLAPGRKALHTRWIFRIKTDTDGNLVYKARLVVKGYEQIPGVDFTETFSPVAGDTTIRTVLATAMYLGWSCEAIDVEAAFLNADLDEDVYVEIPQGYDSGGNKSNVYKLLKAVYGIVQAPRCWSKTFTKSLIAKGFEPSKVDPCLFILREDGEKSPIIGLLVNYVDDGIVVGSKVAIEIIKSKIKEDFSISELGPLKKHLGVNYTWKKDEIGSFWEVQMREFRNDLIKDYLEATNSKKVKASATPGTPGRTLIKNEEDAIMESEYRKMVGKLLWTVKKESPDCANAVRELSAHLSNPGKEQWVAVARIVGFPCG